MGNFPSMNWRKARSARAGSRLDPDYLYVQGCSSNPEGLHKNCKGCQHTEDNKCKFIRFPKQRKWPCYFRTNCPSSSAG